MITIQSITDSFESILDNSAVVIDTTVDLLKDEECAKSIPFVSIVMAAYHIGKTIREKHHLEKLTEFIQEIAAGTADEERQKKYLTKWHADRKQREKELEYLIVIIDRYLHKDMARMVARIYLAFLEGKISWQEVLGYSAVIDRLLPGDYEALKRGNIEDVDFNNTEDTILRLVGLGLMVSHGKDMQMTVSETLFIPVNSRSDFNITNFGQKLLKIIG